jgi:hypothetical protein
MNHHIYCEKVSSMDLLPHTDFLWTTILWVIQQTINSNRQLQHPTTHGFHDRFTWEPVDSTKEMTPGQRRGLQGRRRGIRDKGENSATMETTPRRRTGLRDGGHDSATMERTPHLKLSPLRRQFLCNFVSCHYLVWTTKWEWGGDNLQADRKRPFTDPITTKTKQADRPRPNKPKQPKISNKPAQHQSWCAKQSDGPWRDCALS